MSRPIEDVTIQSARAFTAALVLAYTTTVRSGCASQKAANSSAGQPRSSEHVASRSAIKIRFSGLRILAVSPMNLTPATTSVLAGPAKTLVVAGVRFMGETAKILSPEKRILMADLDATCSLDLGCPADEFAAFCDAHPDRTVVVYANTSAAVKARADWMVTSSIGLDIVAHLHAQGKKILWAPDRHLGAYIQKQTGADMLLWNGACIVHDEFKAVELELMMAENPGAKVLVHP